MHVLADYKKSYYYFLAVALLIHSAALVVKLKDSFSPDHIAKFDENKTEAIKVQFLPENYKDQTRTPTRKQQIVQSENSANKEKPKDTAFLSDQDRTFDRQTIAKNVDIFNKAGQGKTAVNKPVTKGKEEVAAAEPKKAPAKNLKLSDLGMAMNEPMPKEVKRAPASVSDQGLANGDPMSQGLSATNDYVEEVALGDFTHMNTVEFKFYGFYHRIRQKLEQFWGRSIQEKAHNIFRQGRRIPASEDLITSLRITMNAKGEIVHVKILGSAGVKELDDAAIESFNEAGPFPNPPKELLVNGKAVIEWGFVVKT